jgi:hypothetical protein
MPNAESATLCFAALYCKFRIVGVFTVQMMTIVSEDRFQGKAAVTLKELRLGEEEEGWLMRFNKMR